MKIISLDIETALAILDALGCSVDPIFRKGEETTPQDLDYYYNPAYDTKASSVRITFYTNKGKIKGSLYSMVVDRLTRK